MSLVEYCDTGTFILGCTQINSPVGQIELTGSIDGLRSLALKEKRNIGNKMNSSDIDTVAKDDICIHLNKAQEEIADYFDGRLHQFSVILDLKGTYFQKLVWKEISHIGYGERCTYQDIAKRIHRSKAARAVGAANGANPVPIILPCHRVVGKNGNLTGYAYGVEIKRFLLDLENSYEIDS